MAIRVFIVDDDPEFIQSLGHHISASPSMVLAGSSLSADDGLRQISKFAPDVVLIDVNLPGMGGVECTRRIKLKRPKVSVIMITGMAQPSAIFDAFVAGASGYLFKPLTPLECKEAIEEAYLGGVPFSKLAIRALVQHLHRAGVASADKHGLTRREQEIVNLLFKGLADKEIAGILKVSTATVHTHTFNLYGKLGVSSRTEAVRKFFQPYDSAGPAIQLSCQSNTTLPTSHTEREI